MEKTNESKTKTTMAKKRFRPSPALKAWAKLNGLKLRGRGRPRKSSK
jgi:hypothetical protein